MNDSQRRMLADIERDEAWFAETAMREPSADAGALERVKAAVRSQLVDVGSDPHALRAANAARLVVRRELAVRSASMRARRIVFRLLPAAGLAAALAIAVIVGDRSPTAVVVGDGDAEVFVEALTGETDDIDSAIAELAADMADIEQGWMTDGGSLDGLDAMMFDSDAEGERRDEADDTL